MKLHLVDPGRDAARPLASAISAAELSRRPARAPDHAAESRALIALAKEMAASSEGLLQKLAEIAMVICRAHSAGVSLLEETDQKKNFHWRAVAGALASHLGRATPRDFGPCGAVLDRDAALLFSHPERDFPYLAEIEPLLDEGLLVPFHVNGEAVGTLWVAAHDESCRFDAEDLRVLTSLGTFAAAAYQNLLSLNAARRIAFIVESSDDAIVGKSLEGIISSWNQGATRLFGYLPDEVIGQPITILIPPDRQGEERMIIERIRRGERIDHYETIRRRKDGSLVPISLTISPVRDGAGRIVGASKIARDISERKQKEEHIALLSREVAHRSKNLLALVVATVRLAQGETPEALKKAIVGRIQALANAHALLEQSHWAGADLRNLVAQELSPYAPDGESRAALSGPSLLLKPKSAQTVAVVLHELTTNAVKYGSLSVPAGRIQVEWSFAPDGRLVIVWTETGGPPVELPTRRGLGTLVIEQAVKGELQGDAQVDWRREGLVCRLTVNPAIEF